MKKILGLDLGTNSIGGALLDMPESIDDFGKEGNIEWVGSRIIPMDGYVSSKTGKAFKENPFDTFSKGIGISKAASRRIKRGSRRLKQRYKLRRTRLIQVFKILGWIDEKFPENFKKKMNTEENFFFRISDYLPIEKTTIDEATKLLGIINKKHELVLPEDWIVYYLRKKALTKKISIAELCRITYMMNQRRGFKSSRKDLKDENVSEIKKVVELTIRDVIEKGEKNKKKVFEIIPDDNSIGTWEEQKFKKPEWVGKKNMYLITWRNGKRLKPELVSEDDYEPAMVALGEQMSEENKYPGEFFFDKLIKDKNYKIRQFPVYRKKYKSELEAIWNKQIELNEDLKLLNTDKEVLKKIAEKLYTTQTLASKPKLNEVLSNTLLHFISEDIIYYQRDLKSQKGSRGECQYESHIGIDREKYGVKCAPKSSPEFQEMRMWQDVHNIKILQRNAIENGYEKVDVDVTQNFIDEPIKEKLFDLFDNKKEISQQDIFDTINKNDPTNNLNNDTHRINMFFEGKDKLDGNQTKEYFRKIFRNEKYDGEYLLNNKEKFYKLWNISYSISLNDEEKSIDAIFKALIKKENKRKKSKQITFDLSEKVAKAIASAPDIETSKKYASYSSKAIHKLLPLMCCGKHYDETKITDTVKKRAKEITVRLNDISHNPKRIHEIADDDIQKQLLKSFIGKKDLLQGLNTYQACYLVYDRHSERVEGKKYIQSSDFNIMEKLPNNSLRNPVVEQVIREALFVVKDVWEKYGQPDEIHIEMGRDLKKNAKQRESATKSSTKNYEEKNQIRKLLFELFNDEFEQYETDDNAKDKRKKITTRFVVNPNPDNPRDIDRFKLWQQSAGFDKTEFNELFKSGNKTKVPTKAEIKKYALWLSQRCISPYSGNIIPLSKLFDGNQYDFEHILPQSKLKNDSLDNLIICEKGINKSKGGELAAIFIKSKQGKCKYGNTDYKLFIYEDYVAHCKKTFRGKKLDNLLSDTIPEDFISRQINDTRYITKKISELLYPIAKDKDAGIVFTIGAITSDLKREWGLLKEWKQLIKPRFERLEKKNNTKYILQNQKDKNDIDFHIPENPDLDTKRIDHRHHALDAIIIAATTREHIRYFNSLNAVDTDEELKKVKQTLVKGKIREFQLPWETFTKEAKEKLEQTIVTFKTYNKVIDKPKNIYSKWELKEGKWVKNEKVKQAANSKWMAIRQSLFKEPQGLIYIKEKRFIPVKDAFRIQIERLKIESNKEKRKTASYIYDQIARLIITDIIYRTGIDLFNTNDLILEIEKYLKKNSKKLETNDVDKNGKAKNKIVYILNGIEFENIEIAEFKPQSAKRVKLDKEFDHKKIDKIPFGDRIRTSENKKLTIPQILHEHLTEYETFINNKKEIERKQNSDIQLNDHEIKILNKLMPEPFSEEGLEVLDKKVGMRIRMVTIKEKVGLKISLKNQLVEADGNPYLIMYENNQTKERSGIKSLSSFEVIQKRKNGEPILEEKEGFKSIILQAKDIVYVPTKNELEKIKNGILEKDAINWNNKKKIAERLYVLNDFSESDVYFKPNQFSKAINSKELHNSFDDKCSRLIITPQTDKEGNDITEDPLMIKDVCIKINIDRLGNIVSSKVNNYNPIPKEANIISEPEAVYQKSTFKTFNSYEEANEADAKARAALSPEQHLANATQMIKAMYAEELKKPMDKTLHFRKDA